MNLVDINFKPYSLISSVVILEMSAVGRAIFTVRSTTTPRGLISYSINEQPLFTGIVESVQKTADEVYRVVGREISSIFEHITPFAMRNKKIVDILKVISSLSKLKIVTHEDEWLQKQLPHFFSIGSGFLALDNLVVEARFKMPIYNLLSNGTFFIGDYIGSPFDKLVELPEKFFSDISPVSAALTMVETLRPGHRLAIPGAGVMFIEKIEYYQDNMRLYFSPNPWKISS